MEKVAVVKCDSYENELVYNKVKEALDKINFKFKEGLKVLVKPNILTQNKPEEAVTTHPSIVDAVCKLLKEKKCSIIIGESSGFYKEGGTAKGFITSGIKKVAEKYGAKVVIFESGEKFEINNDNNKLLKKIIIGKTAKDVDLMINLPKLKTHTLTKMTGAVKNLYGLIPGGLKQKYHVIAYNEERLCQLLIDLYQNIKVDITIMDGVIGIEGNGPGPGGEIRKAGVILASRNCVAMDIVASRIMGFDPLEIKTIEYAIKRGLFSSVDDVEVVGKIKNLNFKKPVSIQSKLPNFVNKIIEKQLLVNPKVNKKKCTKCGICKDVCAAKAIKLKPYPVVDRKKCIHCYCCHENCRYGAMELKRPFTIEVLSWFWRKFRKLLIQRK